LVCRVCFSAFALRVRVADAMAKYGLHGGATLFSKVSSNKLYDRVRNEMILVYAKCYADLINICKRYKP